MTGSPKPWMVPILFLARRWDRSGHWFRRRFGFRKSLRILPYDGVGNRHLLIARGRVVGDRAPRPAEAGHSRWRNLRGNLRRLFSREVPFAEVVARHGGREVKVKADHEGHFEARIEVPEGLPDDRERHAVSLFLAWPATRDPVSAVAEVSVPRPGARFGILSDIDDTLLHTGSLRVRDMARVLLFRNVHTRLPLPGVSALLQGLAGAAGGVPRPVFCVSSSPWNLHDLLSGFFALRGFPRPVLYLRDWGITPEGFLPTSHRSHKVAAIRQVLDTTAPLPFILLGDSAQEDPEIYAEVVAAFPGRVLAAYIRNVGKDLKRPEAIKRLAVQVLEKGSALLLAEDSVAIAEHARAQGWIADVDLDAVRREVGREAGSAAAAGPGLAAAKTVTGAVPEAVAEVEEGGVRKALESAKGAAPPVLVESPEARAPRKAGESP